MGDSARIRRQRQIAVDGRPVSHQIRGSTAASEVYRILRGEIVSSARKPGEPLNAHQIEAALGVSRTPIREAILRLAAEELVEIVPQAGTFVARIPLDQLPESVVIRRTLERLTLRAAAERAGDEEIVELMDNLAWQRNCIATEDAEAFHAADEALHAAIARIAGFASAWPLIQQVKVQVDRYCHLTLPLAGCLDRLLNEHKAMVDAIRDHDAPAAVAAMEVHLDRILPDRMETVAKQLQP